MKYLILLSYLLSISFVLLYFYYRIGVLKMLSSLTLEEINQEEEFAEEQLGERDFKSIRNFFVGAFSLLGVYLWALMGTTFGAIATEMATSSVQKWILYPILFILMRILFGISHRMVKNRFEIRENIRENVFFALAMLFSYIMAIAYPEWVSGIFSWPVRLVLG